MAILSINPIGFLKSNDSVKFGVPHQPPREGKKNHIVELLPGNNFEAALRDLGGFDRIWLIWWFHKNNSWRPCVMPPRGEAKRRGVFATRSPHRPNPIGISCLPLLDIKGRSLLIGDCDLVDGTPILDIKPYIPEVDSFPEASSGWLQEVFEQYQEEPKFSIKLDPIAQTQIDWLKEHWAIDFIEQASRILCFDPSPHRTRRIVALLDGSYRIGCGAWRLFFTVQDNLVLVKRIAAGYPEHSLFNPAMDRIPDKDAQAAFYKLWENTQN